MNFANLLKLTETSCSAARQGRSQSSRQSEREGAPAAGRISHMLHVKEEAITKVGLLQWVFPFFRTEGGVLPFGYLKHEIFLYLSSGDEKAQKHMYFEG